ncbi:MAG TPA: ThuA domain-containing protein [Sphingobacteriaceae bacterium]|nr:ThuA domain-containing protein [Sphingobacteriaceae bacterium]
MKFLQTIFLSTIVLVLIYSFNTIQIPKSKPRILVFSKTSGFRHTSIPAGKEALLKLAREQGYLVDVTEDAKYFNEDSLKKYSVVVFLSTTGNILNSAQQASFERYIQAGGGFVGIHAAADTEYDWPWYGKLVGGYFLSHPKIQKAIINVVDNKDSSTSHLPSKWEVTDEWYNYKNLNTNTHVLLSLDEKSYTGGKNGNYHPIAWYHNYDGGRAFYTGLGHTEESFKDPLFIKHLAGGIKYAIGQTALNYLKVSTPKVPEENRFVKSILTQGTLYEPTEIAILPNLDVLITQRRGEIMLYKNETKKLEQVGFLDVYFKKQASEGNVEEGLLGIAADPDFAKNQYVYMFYSPIDTSVNRLSRFKLVNDKIDNKSEKVVLEFFSQREICCHTGGSIAFGPDGLLYVSTGDNSTPFDVPNQKFVNNGYGPLDNRPGLEQYDARRSSGNTNDLRGKIIRIKLNDDGTYQIPDGNLFAPGTVKTRPEIYIMGNRNPYRISIDKKTNFLYWGEVGPDAKADDPLRGPRGYDEVNQARKAGFFGWPFAVGNNYPYKEYDFKTGISGTVFNPVKINNTSANNTGLNELPPVQPPFIWYPYGASAEFPEVSEGGRTAMAGPVYYADMYTKTPNSYPDYYNGKLLIYDWVRGWIKSVTLKPNGDYDSMEPFMPGTTFAAPVDMELGHDGKIYVLEYGSGWFTKNPNAALSRIDYLAGNRPPKINNLVISKTSGVLPYKFSASVDVTDPDKDKMTYLWNLGNGITKTSTEPNINYTYTKAGEHSVSVKVTDINKASTNSKTVSVYAGNEHPEIKISVKGNSTFYFPGIPVNYQVVVSDKASIVDKKNVYVSNMYTQGMDMAGSSLGHQTAAENLIGQSLMLKSDCKACHQVSEKSIGPAFTLISARYQKNTKAIPYLASKIIEGGAGIWGEIPMPSHTAMEKDEARKIAEWIISLGNTSVNKPSLPLAGKIIPETTLEDGKSTLVINAAYTDLGSSGVKPLSASNSVYLRSSLLDAGEIKDRNSFAVKDSSGSKYLIFPANTGWLKLNKIDLSGISNVELTGFSRGEAGNYSIEIRLDSEIGKIIGKSALSSNTVVSEKLNALIPLQPIADGNFHALYFVFIADKKDLKQRPVLKTIKFNPY